MKKRKKYKGVWVNPSTLIRLKGARMIDRESMDSVINRALNSMYELSEKHQEVVQNEQRTINK